jgi:hypothetical protein
VPPSLHLCNYARSIHPSIHPSTHVIQPASRRDCSIYLSIYLSISLSLSPSSCHPAIEIFPLGLLSIHLLSAYLFIYLSTYFALAFAYLFNPNITDQGESIPTVTHLRPGTLPCKTDAEHQLRLKKWPCLARPPPRPQISHFVRKKQLARLSGWLS